MKKTILSTLLLLLLSAPLFSQQRGRSRSVNYPMLANRAAAPVFHFDEIQIPGSTPGQAKIVFIFRFDNDFLPFKKITYNDDIEAPDGEEYYSSARLNTEIFEGSARTRNNDFNSVSRDTWQDTLFASTYDDTKSRSLYTPGYLDIELAPGEYNYLLQLTVMGETNERNTNRQNLRVKDFSEAKKGEIYITRSAEVADDRVELLNLGDKVFYGKDYGILVRIPNYDASSGYSVEVEKVRTNREDTTAAGQVYDIQLENEQIMNNKMLAFTAGGNLGLELRNSSGNGYTYAFINIPNSTFENSSYRIKVMKAGEKEAVASKVIRSYWPDMPPALFSLDMSLDMLKYIVSEEQLRELKSGNTQEKEKKFREFWSTKDPTPNTEYNELMAEYYRRIDYAFKEFSNPEFPLGQETDMGNVYIKYGPPQSKQRTFPEQGRVIETWSYGNQTFVFEKGSGFSQFELVGRQ